MNPDAVTPLLVLAACPIDNSLEGTPRLSGNLNIKIMQDSLAFCIYNKIEVWEPFTCNYELNPNFRDKLETAGLKVSGVSADGGARIIELPDHDFFIGTGFVPQLASRPDHPHLMISAFLKAAQK
jgi:CTP synthase (UTP-ammonia lyase)